MINIRDEIIPIRLHNQDIWYPIRGGEYMHEMGLWNLSSAAMIGRWFIVIAATDKDLFRCFSNHYLMNFR